MIDPNQYYGKAAIRQKRQMRTAVGSAQWLTIHYHLSTDDAIKSIREQHHHHHHHVQRNNDNNDDGSTTCSSNGIVFYASDLGDESQDIRTIAWDTNLPKIDETSEITATATAAVDPAICIVMGNEERGISDTMKRLVDYTFKLPMVGFAESYNLSVATAITLAHLSAKSSTSSSNNKNIGPIRPGDLNNHHYQCLLLKGLMNSVAQKRIIQPLLKQENIFLPFEIIKSI